MNIILEKILGNVKNTIIVALVIALGAFGFMYTREKKAHNELQAKIEGLPKDAKGQITIEKDNIKIVSKDKDGKIVYTDRYVPPEGSVVITVKEKEQLQNKINDLVDKIKKATTPELIKQLQDELSNTKEDLDKMPDVVIKDKGFCHKAGAGVGYDFAEKPSPELDVKLLYFKRYGAGIGSTLNEPFLYASRHVDDLSGPLGFSNLELWVGYGRAYKDFSQDRILIGLRTNF